MCRIIIAGDIAVCGTRGWKLPHTSQNWTSHDDKIYAREQLRLRMSLEAARKDGYERIIVAMHYPPAEMKNSRNEFTEIIGEFEPELVIYGHLHGSYARQFSFNGRIGATDYRLVSCDYLGFVPILAAQTKESRGGILCQEGKTCLRKDE